MPKPKAVEVVPEPKGNRLVNRLRYLVRWARLPVEDINLLAEAADYIEGMEVADDRVADPDAD